MKLHLLGLPHTITSSEHSHCAFTGKVKRFSPMMRGAGYEVVHYGVEGADSSANRQIDVLSREEWSELRERSRREKGLSAESVRSFAGDLADTDTALYRTFNERLREILVREVRDERDLICLPFGHAHDRALTSERGRETLPNTKVETGIGYPTLVTSFRTFRVFESNAWLHWHLGRANRAPYDYDVVIPNYYDVSEWELGKGNGGYVLYMGRLDAIKGLEIVCEIARRRPDVCFRICGQGNPEPWLRSPNVFYHPPISGVARSGLLGEAEAVLVPSRYVEPFAGVTVEALLTGTPVLTSDFGAFTETVVEGRDGYRCRTIGDWLDGLDRIRGWSGERRLAIREAAKSRYDMHVLARSYDRFFRELDDLWTEGWNTERSHR